MGGSAFSVGGSSGTFKRRERSPPYVGGNNFSSSSSSWNDRGNHIRHYHPQANPASNRRHQNGRGEDYRQDTCNFKAISAIVAVMIGSLFLMFVLNGSKQVEMGLNYSRILKANKFFTDRIIVRNLEQVPGAHLYLFENQPLLNNTKEWSVQHNILMSSYQHQQWAFWLNQGSEIKMVYNLPFTSSLFIIIAKGRSNFDDWIQDPFNSDSCLLWRFVRGHGQIRFKADSDDEYYFGLGNSEKNSVEMTLQMEIKSKLYETETANSWCKLDEKCEVVPSLKGSEVGLLTTPDMPQGGSDVWKIKISYNTCWKTYLLFNGALLFAIFLIWGYVCKSNNQQNLHPEETPLNLERDTHAQTREAVPESNPVRYNEPNSRTFSTVNTAVEETSKENVCIICFEKDKNSFFLPCGHCPACDGCSLRIKEATGFCLICRDPIQDIRKKFNV